MRVCKLLAAFLLALYVTGCAGSWRPGMPSAPPSGTGVTPTGEVVEGDDAISTASIAAASNESGTVQPFGASGHAAAYEYLNGYRVGAGDRLTIRVLGQRELTGQFIVDAAGQISLPLIHTIKVAGLNSQQIERKVVAKLRGGFLRDPSVSIQVTSMRPFFILGEVNQAGSFPYQPGMTVQNAIALGSGYTPRANHKDVLLTRKSIEGTGTHKVPLTTQLYPGDIVFVRERWF